MFYIPIILFFGCASIKTPSGGPVDRTPPFLMMDKLVPSSNINIKKNQRIKFFFNERIDPNTTLGAITIEPEQDIVIRPHNNAITITPKGEWPEQFKVFISRKITDYFSNNLVAPVNLLFSRGDTIYNNHIEGTLFNIDSTKIYEVAIIDNNGSIISKTESNISGKYNFSGLKDYSSYIILAVEDKISDNIFKDVRSRNYGLSNREINQKDNPILISPPIYRAIINNINLINNQYGKINLTNNISFDVIFNNSYMKSIIGESKNYLYFDHNFEDSLSIALSINNDIENYMIDKTVFLSETVVDTLPPSITQYVSEDSLFLEFTEPILIDNNLMPFYYYDSDSNSVNINYEYLTPQLLYLKNIEDSKLINVRCQEIVDLASNFLCDSLLSVSVNLMDKDKSPYGEINGTVIYEGSNNLISEAKNLKTGGTIAQKIIDNKFKFDQLSPGDYRICVYEDINSIGETYFSGILEPIKLSAKFSIYNKSIYVRENWSNTILVEFK